MSSPDSPEAVTLDTRFEPYRIGTGRLLAFPVKTSSACKEMHLSEDGVMRFMRGTDSIFSSAEVELITRDLTRRHHHETSSLDVPLTLLIRAEIADKTAFERQSLAINLMRYCKDSELDGVQVVIIEAGYDGRVRTVGLGKQDDSAVEQWRSLADQIVKYLDAIALENKCNWISLDLFRRGFAETGRQPCYYCNCDAAK